MLSTRVQIDIKITDDGRGMNTDVIKHLGLGYTTSGSGTGFASVRRDLVLMGGTVEVLSEVNIFTQVCLRFKRAIQP